MTLHERIRADEVTIEELKLVLTKYDDTAKIRVNRNMIYVIQAGRMTVLGDDPEPMPAGLKGITDEVMNTRASVFIIDPEYAKSVEACVLLDADESFEFIDQHGLLPLVGSGQLLLIESIGQYVYMPRTSSTLSGGTIVVFNEGFIEGIRSQ